MSDFWARRRRAVEAEARAEAEAAGAAEEARAREALEALPEAEALERLGLPDPDTLGPGDDVAAFMARAVPAYLRNRALRRLWTQKPVLANLDGLADYAEDFTGNGLGGRALATSYRVGEGLAAHVRRMAEAAEAEAREGEALVNPSEKESTLSEGCDEKNVAAGPADVEPSGGIPPDPTAGGEETRLQRRMAFSFEEDDEDERPHPAGPGPAGA